MQEWTPEDLKKHLDDGKAVFLKLWKRGCGICKLSTPATERMESTNKHHLVFASINVDDHPEMLEVSGAESLPSFFVFKDGENKGHYIGFKGLQKLEEFVDHALGASS